MKNFVISVDSSASFSNEELNKYGILMVRFSYTLDGREFTDSFENDEQKQALYDKLSRGSMAQSSKATPHSFIETWRQTLIDGYDILHLSLSNQVSGSYESACMAAKELEKEYGRRIAVVDTLTGSFAVTALAMDLMRIQSTATVEEARDFALAGEYLLCANELSDNVQVFSLKDPVPQKPVCTFAVEMPWCVLPVKK